MSDLISRSEVWKAFISRIDSICDLGDVREILDSIPSAEPKVGRWEPHPAEPEWDICTVCGIGTHRRQITMGFVEEENYQYCPHCGAKMEE